MMREGDDDEHQDTRERQAEQSHPRSPGGRARTPPESLKCKVGDASGPVNPRTAVTPANTGIAPRRRFTLTAVDQGHENASQLVES